MTNLCGSCSFKKEKNLVERKEIFADVIELLTVNPGLELLCPNCDNQFIIVDGVLTTRSPAEITAVSEKSSLQMDFFEMMRNKGE